MITKRQMGLAMPAALAAGRLDTWYIPLVDAMTKHDITTDARIAPFLANVAAETGQLQAKVENLNYSGDRLIAVFPSLFSANPNKAYELAAAGPEAIANYIYADANRPPGYRMGNTQPGDGWKYRGRGPNQLTGRSNYVRYFASIGLPADSDPDIVLDPTHGANSSADHWVKAGCNQLADAGNFEGIVRAINGGLNGLATRQTYLERFVAALRNPDPVAPAPPPPPVEPPTTEPAIVAAPLPPIMEPIPPMPPVPPPGYSVQPSGNVVRDNVEDDPIVKLAKVGKYAAGGAGAATAVGGAVVQAKGALTGISDVAVICLTVVALALIFAVGWYLHRAAKDRRDLHRRGIV